MDTRHRWVDLRAKGKFWAKYCPATNQIEFTRGDIRVTFDLSIFQAQQPTEQQKVQDATRQRTIYRVE